MTERTARGDWQQSSQINDRPRQNPAYCAVQASKANELCSFVFEPNKQKERSDYRRSEEEPERALLLFPFSPTNPLRETSCGVCFSECLAARRRERQRWRSNARQRLRKVCGAASFALSYTISHVPPAHANSFACSVSSVLS